MRARVGLPMVKSRSTNMTSTIGDKISYSLPASRPNGILSILFAPLYFCLYFCTEPQKTRGNRVPRPFCFSLYRWTSVCLIKSWLKSSYLEKLRFNVPTSLVLKAAILRVALSIAIKRYDKLPYKQDFILIIRSCRIFFMHIFIVIEVCSLIQIGRHIPILFLRSWVSKRRAQGGIRTKAALSWRPFGNKRLNIKGRRQSRGGKTS